eukprot:TRINITY_DN36558_c0_g2_i1.p1 TRINITY_DN36558_c0_g2~~TRINITY_DN36558_c0_g2_i1.p1  ORF type:complete len:1095 (+),score=226.46 TRINITY_DN36558_c0_g2_i1:175-3459(+)
MSELGGRMCDEDGGGMLLPLFRDEYRWSGELRIFLYGFGLVYMFVGVSIIAEMFMSAIEEITSRRKQVVQKDGTVFTAKVWNATVANLTLLALGSSAPEILLAVVEIFNKNFFTGELGAATIVGSASFNLLVIIGLCVFVVPSSEIRRMAEMEVFVVTVVFMLFAYLWLVVIVVFISPDIIDIWEALVTLGLLPILVYVSYLADNGTLRRLRKMMKGQGGVSEDEQLAQLALQMLKIKSDDDESATMLAIRLAVFDDREGVQSMVESGDPADREKLQQAARSSRAARRLAATRAKGKGGQSKQKEAPDIPVVSAKGEGRPMIQFASVQQSLSKELLAKRITILRCGDHSAFTSLKGKYTLRRRKDRRVTMSPIVVKLYAELQAGGRPDLSGTEDTFEIVSRGQFEMLPEEEMKELIVDMPRAAGAGGLFEEFIMQLEKAEVVKDGMLLPLELGPFSTTVVTVVPAEKRGVLCFPYEQILIAGDSDTRTLQCMVERLDGCSGRARCSYRTMRLTSVPGFDYEEAEGELEFPPGVTERFVDLQILPKRKDEVSDQFMLLLEEVEGAHFDPTTDGGEDSQVLTIHIGARDLSNETEKLSRGQSGERLAMLWLDSKVNCDEVRLARSAWRDQLMEAIFCGGSREAQAEAEWFDWCWHFFTVPWKLFFLPVPPTILCRGWVCFIFSLCYIGCLTAYIGEMAEIFGCVCNMPDLVTGIVCVALGTSMPDLFASRTAAVQDPTSDAAIVNVTGSNSVNVFLGLGIPWTMGAVVWAIRGPTAEWQMLNSEVAGRPEMKGRAGLVIKGAAEFTFGVIVFTVVALLAICLLMVRRRTVGGELGGPLPFKVMSSVTLLLLWIVYIVLASWNSIYGKDSSQEDLVTVVAAVGVPTMFVYLCTCVLSYFSEPPPTKVREPEEPKEEKFRSATKTSVPLSPGREVREVTFAADVETSDRPLESLKEEARAEPKAKALEPISPSSVELDSSPQASLREVAEAPEEADLAARKQEKSQLNLPETSRMQREPPPQPKEPQKPPQPQAPQNVAMSLEEPPPLWRPGSSSGSAFVNDCGPAAHHINICLNLPICRTACCSLTMPDSRPPDSQR